MNLNDAKKLMSARVANRIMKICEKLPSGTYWIAGGAMTRDGNDVDFFSPDTLPLPPEGSEVVSKSKNATTFHFGGDTFQFCNYKKPTLTELVASFDFAHCQIGCVVEIAGGNFVVSDVTWTPAFEACRITGCTWFVGSEYPLSSLVRVSKYHKKGVMTRGESIHATLDILRAVVKRGFKDWDDFKDQLDAVDLGLLPDDLESVNRSDLKELFELLLKPEAAL